jgi:hypothetical protein
VIGIQGVSRFAAATPEVGFIDIEEIPGSLTAPLPRIAELHNLPAAGAHLPPLLQLSGRQAVNTSA